MVICERCGTSYDSVEMKAYGMFATGEFTCPRCNPPRKTVHERLDEFRIWLDYGESYWRYPAWWALITLAAFCVVNAVIIFAMLIKWIWGF